MRIICSILAASLVFVTGALADLQIPCLKVGYDVYSNLTIISVTATDINFLHSRGVANAKLKDLDPEWQKFFHYNPTGASGAQGRQAQANFQYQQQMNTGQSSSPAAQPALDDAEIRVPQLFAKSFLNQRAPAFTADQWLTTPPQMAGKFILIDFWATWCGPCRQSIPHLNDLYARYKDKVAFIGLTDQSADAVQAMTSPTIDYAVASDPEQRMMREVEVRGIPHAMLIDPKGIVRFEGMPEYLTDDELGRLLARYGQ